MRIPRATYRLQLNGEFTFKAVESLLPYFEALGISDLYLSPINTAPPESTHGYDVWDYQEVNPTLGGRAGLEALAAAAKAHGIGLLVDFVPNHMGVAGNGNRWWRDVLKHGPASKFAKCFDIHWHEENGVPKIRLPVLGDFRQSVIERGEIKLYGDELSYLEHTFPIAPGTKVEGDAIATLEKQHYRLIHWRHGTEQINYRRFFEVNTLAGIAVERPDVFERVHALLLEFIRSKTISGLRLDHIDGLACPNRYLQELYQAAGGDFFVLVEKILGPHERLPALWPVQGTTGYDFMIDVGQLWIDSRNEAAFTDIYRVIADEPDSLDEMVAKAKGQVLRTLFYSEFHALLRRALALAGAHPLYCDLSPRAVEGALEALMVHLPVYRTYAVCGKRLSDADRKMVAFAQEKSRERLTAFFGPALDFLVEVWTANLGGDEGNRFRIKLQQLTGPVMAKGVEDTAFYRYHRFIALNEVGGEPSRFGMGVNDFHAICEGRMREQPHSMLATSTHDTKFSEDVRCRLSVLSEIPEEWARFVHEWQNLSKHSPLRPNDEYRLLQAVVGVWPVALDGPPPAEIVERFINFARKSLREAKVQTSWLEPNEAWEKTVFDYVRNVFGSVQHREILNALVRRIAPFGALNSLSQTLLKLTTPGFPDIYQGNELWDFSMVDPDNRRAVDYNLRADVLVELDHKTPTELVRDWPSGAIKMKVIRDTLGFRREHPALFEQGEYCAVEVQGELANHCLAFTRSQGDDGILVAVPRLCAALGFTPAWKNTRLTTTGAWQNIFTGEGVIDGDLNGVFGPFPVALLTRSSVA
jgi:(1->4)-alpha-D-glucan 1-alpha-D-glucosylmutase